MSCCRGEELTVIATAYTYTGNRTCSGAFPFPGTVAADHSILPIGSIIYVENYGYAVVLDSGSLITGKRIDVFFETENACILWGKRTVKIKILRKGIK